MSINNIPLTSNTGASSPFTQTPVANNTGQALSQQDFLKIMIAEFTSQNPLASDSGGGGSSSSDYVNQLMNMTNLTTMQTMSTELGTSTTQQAVSLAQSLTGATVQVNDQGKTIQGVVQNASISGTNVTITINGVKYDSSLITSVLQPNTTTKTS